MQVPLEELLDDLEGLAIDEEEEGSEEEGQEGEEGGNDEEMEDA